LIISRPSSNMGHVWSKTRSPGQILEKSFLNITSDLDPQVSPVVFKAMKKGTLINLHSQVSVPGPSGPSCLMLLKSLTGLNLYHL